MKKLILCLTTVLLLGTTSSTNVMAASKPMVESTIGPGEAAHVDALLTRLNEIEAMDMSTLSRSERKDLRNEARSTKAHLHDHGHGGIFISGGAVLIVLLLIILL